MFVTEVMAWQRKQFTILTESPLGRLSVDGIVLGAVPIGLHIRDGYRVDVTHLPSGKRMGSMTTLGAAMEFVHRVAHMLDWTVEAPEVPPVFFEIRAQIEAGAHPPRAL